MPSPDDWVSIYEAEKISGIKYKVISGWVDAGYLKSKIGRYFKPNYSPRTREGVGKKTRMFLWKDFEAIRAKYIPGLNNQNNIRELQPDGYITVADAGLALGVDRTYIRKLMTEKRLPYITIRAPGVGKKVFLYVEKKAVNALVEEKGTYRRIGFVPAEDKPPDNPLICGNHATCLQARRELWETRGRKFRNCVDLARKVG